MLENNTYEPKIVAFCCNWCSYAGADGADGDGERGGDRNDSG